MQENIKAKWSVTDGELRQTREELYVRIKKGCYQNKHALLALLELLVKGDITKTDEVIRR